MINQDSVLKSRDITLPAKVCLVKAMVFPVVMSGCESWTIKEAERWRIYVFELWCWRRLLKVPWTTRRSNQLIFFFFNFTILYWFCHTSTCIRHGCTCVPNPEPPPTCLPIPSLWVIPVHQPQASCILHRTWTGDLFLILYYTCFNAILANHRTLSLSHRVQKTVLYICVSFAVSHTGLSLPSF